MRAIAEADDTLTQLAAAKTVEKEAARLRREGYEKEAIATYNQARGLYADTGLVHDGGDLADDVLRAIKRCDKTVYNLRNPKQVRVATLTPRPNCLSCKKPLRRYTLDGKTFEDGTPREWGSYGDNRFCGLTCGWTWACQHAALPTKAPTKAKP